MMITRGIIEGWRNQCQNQLVSTFARNLANYVLYLQYFKHLTTLEGICNYGRGGIEEFLWEMWEKI